jgi:hypothetical protein
MISMKVEDIFSRPKGIEKEWDSRNNHIIVLNMSLEPSSYAIRFVYLILIKLLSSEMPSE